MPDNKEQEKQEQPEQPEPTKADREEGPTREDLAKIAIEAQRQAAEAREFARQQGQQQPRQQVVDPLKAYTENDLLMSPEERRRALSDAMMLRARAESERAKADIENRLARERSDIETKFAVDMVTSQRPDLVDPKNAPNFAAAVTKARYEAQAAGVELSPLQLSQKAVGYYDQMFGSKGAQRPPFVEGQSRPDMTTGVQAPPEFTPQSALEKQYGIKKGRIRPMYDVNDPEQVNALNMEYIHRKNTPLFKKGMQSNLDAVLATIEENPS